MACPECGSAQSRLHRNPLQKIFFTDWFLCTRCRAEWGRPRAHLAILIGSLRFVFSSTTHCIDCGSENVDRLTSRDRLESFSRNPLGLLQFLIGAPIFHCPLCRHMYYDWRHPRPKRLPPREPGPTA